MMGKSPTLSIIILHYKVYDLLTQCIESIYKYPPDCSFEIIVVDNDEQRIIQSKLIKKFPKIAYIASNGNVGFGAGLNKGVSIAKGEYYLFLNPDCILKKDSINLLYYFEKKSKNVGIASSLLEYSDGTINPYCGTQMLTPIRAVAQNSFLRHIFLKFKRFKNFYIQDYTLKKPIFCDAVQTACFMMKKDVLEKIGRFDEQFFLFFEEYDLCQRTQKAEYSNYIVPASVVIHDGGKSMEQNKNVSNFFKKSRFLYFKKYYGENAAGLLNMILSVSFWDILVFLTLCMSVFITFNKLPNLMVLIGDQGWFYISAKNMITTGQIPLVGIPSSHPWLTQGALWTYILSLLFLVFSFNPLAPGFFTAGMNVITIALLFYITKSIFSKPIGFLAAFLYATSPLVIIYSRMPYHTSLISLFSLLYFYSLYLYIKGKKIFFALSLFLLSILYSLEIAATLLAGVFVGVLAYGLYTKKSYVRIGIKNLLLGLIAVLVPLIPILIYDTQNNFPHTIKYIAWIGYRILVFLGILQGQTQNISDFLGNSSLFIQRTLFMGNKEMGLLIGAISFLLFVVLIARKVRSKSITTGESLLTLFIGVFLTAYWVNKTASEAYLPLIFPFVFIMIAWVVCVISKKQIIKLLLIALFIGIGCVNIYELLNQNYLMGKKDGYGVSFETRMDVAEIMVTQANSDPFSIRGKGEGSQFLSFTDNYEYLAWYLGGDVVKRSKSLEFLISESNNNVGLTILTSKR